MNESRAALNEFLAESHENLDRLDCDLVDIEADPDDRKALDRIFRTFHNLKGTCGFFELAGLGSLAHAGEDLLDQLRQGTILWHLEITTSLLKLADAVRGDLIAIEETGSETQADHQSLIDWLARLQNKPPPDSLPKGPGGGSSSCSGGRGGAIPPPIPSGESREGFPSIDLEDDPRSSPSSPPDLAQGHQVRVDVELLDRLMDLVGELVLTRNQMLQHAASWPDNPLSRDSHRLNQVTSALRDGVMKARMKPIGTLWDRIPRVVRDLAVALGKQVRVSTEGGATDLDRTVIEAIKDPLVHLVRNAVDHGIEGPDARKAMGKPESGTLSLRATHHCGLVHLEIGDDGSGIDPEKVARKAIKLGLISREQAQRMDLAEAARLIFEPGFSTAESITEVSGRGVGLDVVRANIEAIGGTVEVKTQAGEGTTFVLKIPLTLAIIPTLIVANDSGDRYAIPQPSLVELIRLDGDPNLRMVETIGCSTFLRYRGELLPVFGLEYALGDPWFDPRDRLSLDLVVLRTQARMFGLLVGQICDTEEIVVKPLSRPIRQIPQFAGTTILGDGRVALILDIPGIARGLGLSTAPNEREPALKSVESPAIVGNHRPFLMLGLLGGRRLAVPLLEVSRIEEVATSAIELASGVEVIQRQGRLLPLVRPGGRTPLLPGLNEPGSIQVVVCGESGRPIGLVVDAILDIVEADPQLEQILETPGILGSALFGDRVADLVDVAALMLESSLGGSVGP